jgi:hypothetical protein
MIHTRNEKLQHCIDECQSCHEMCVETAAHCLQQGGQYADVRLVTTLLDCAEICATSANFMLRGSHSHPRTCEVCAEICEQCARSCESLGDDMMRRCAEECRRCAESCRQISRTTARV